jgi:hypothetical protein
VPHPAHAEQHRRAEGHGGAGALRPEHARHEDVDAHDAEVLDRERGGEPEARVGVAGRGAGACQRAERVADRPEQQIGEQAEADDGARGDEAADPGQRERAHAGPDRRIARHD